MELPDMLHGRSSAKDALCILRNEKEVMLFELSLELTVCGGLSDFTF
jgi:hypothetical protein